MDSVEGIEEFCFVRREIVGSVISYCDICKNVAWLNSYGNYTCRNCCSFFVNSMLLRADYWCICELNCQYGVKCSPKCNYCWLKSCFCCHLDPFSFGKSKSTGSNYLEETREQREKIRFKPPMSPEGYREMNIFAEHFEWDFIETCDLDVLSSLYPQFTFFPTPIVSRFVILLILSRSMFAHGNLMLKKCFMDPYKCLLPSLQDLTIEMLKMLECLMKRKLVLDGDTMKTLIDMADIDDSVLTNLQYKLLRIDNLLNIFIFDLTFYANRYLQEHRPIRRVRRLRRQNL